MIDRETRRRPGDLLRSLGITEPRHIDLEAIAACCDADIRFKTLDGCEARIVGNEESAIISVDKHSRPSRQRFSVAHELGHWNLDRGKTGFLCKKSEITSGGIESIPKAERRANNYAAELLLPRLLLEPRLEDCTPGLDFVREVSEEFRTSLTATAIRVTHLTERATAVASFAVEESNWTAKSPNWPTSVFPVRELDPQLEAFELLYDSSKPSTTGSDQLSGRNVDRLLNGRIRDVSDVAAETVKITENRILVMMTIS